MKSSPLFYKEGSGELFSIMSLREVWRSDEAILIKLVIPAKAGILNEISSENSNKENK
jgi:hypothetical protein